MHVDTCVCLCVPPLLSVRSSQCVCKCVQCESCSVSVCQQWFSLKGYPLSTSANPYQIRVCWYWRHLSFFTCCAWTSGLGWAGLSLEGDDNGFFVQWVNNCHSALYVFGECENSHTPKVFVLMYFLMYVAVCGQRACVEVIFQCKFYIELKVWMVPLATLLLEDSKCVPFQLTGKGICIQK